MSYANRYGLLNTLRSFIRATWTTTGSEGKSRRVYKDRRSSSHFTGKDLNLRQHGYPRLLRPH